LGFCVKLIVGLGNPGYEYHRTPHNLGFMAVDRLANACGVQLAHREAQALTGSTELAGVRVLLAKPQTYMNLSGLAVARLLRNRGLASRDLLVLVDDIELRLGTLRIRPRGSAGGHNGLKSIIGALETDDFTRLRMGVRPERQLEEYVSYLLGPFHPAEWELVTGMLDQAKEAVRVILLEGVQKAMNRFNRRIPSPES
jgi:peptidyl-tRNA hydrolase, PTH1 family